MFSDWNTIGLMTPEIILVGSAMWIYVAGAFKSAPRFWPGFALFVFLVTFGVMGSVDFGFWANFSAGRVAFSGPLNADMFGQMTRMFSVLLGVVFVLMLWRGSSQEITAERMGTVMLSVVGLMLTARANELTFLFLGLEMISIPTYMLLFIGRRDRASGEATTKYFFLSLLSSGLFLYGLSFLYGLTGTTTLSAGSDVPGIKEALANLARNDQPDALLPLASVAWVLIVAGLGFKIAIVPFHFYAPDVYQGTTNGNAGLLAVLPKIAGIVALTRLSVVMAPAVSDFAWQTMVVLAILSMTLGNICALWQKNLRRLLAYSSIAHSGYMLVGVAVGLAAGQGGFASTLFYALVYAAASLGTFAAISFLESDDKPVNTTDDLAGLGQAHPVMAGVIAVCMFSFSGIPIFAGFWGKFGLFLSAMSLIGNDLTSPTAMWFIVLSVVGVLNAAIAAAYYLRIIALMFFHPAKTQVPCKGGFAPLAASLLCSLVILGLGFAWRPVMQLAGDVEPNLARNAPRPAMSTTVPPAGEATP